jgi:hypothetical protein
MSIRFKANNAGFNELRTSAGAKAVLKRHADDVEAAANAIAPTTDIPLEDPYYKVYDGSDEKRARYRVATTSIRASRHEAKTFALERALSSDG